MSKLGLIYLQMPAFTKNETELENKFDKWAYFLKNLEKMESIPQILNEQVFQQAFQTAELANMTKEQRDDYEKSRLSYIGIKQVTQTAEKDGMKKGEEKKEIEAILGMHKIGIPMEKIAEALNISVIYVNNVLNEGKK